MLYDKQFIRTYVKQRWQDVGAYTKLQTLLETINPNNQNAICNKNKIDFDKNFYVNPVFGTKNYEYLNDAVYSYTCHKDAVTWFYNWMNQHINYANSWWGN